MTARGIVVYTTMFCSYCQRAKALLASKGFAFEEIPVDGDRAAREALAARAGGRTTVPQVFIGDRHVGGYDELHALETGGKLDALIRELAD